MMLSWGTLGEAVRCDEGAGRADILLVIIVELKNLAFRLWAGRSD